MSNSFIEQINNMHGKRQTSITEMIESKLPVIIYGAGLTGNNVQKYLELNDISVVGFLVDKGYGENSTMSDLPVELYSYYCNKYESFCVIIAIQNMDRAVSNLQDFNSFHMKSVYCLCEAPSFLGLIYDYNYVRLHQDDFEAVYSALSDEVSRRTMINYVNSIVTDNFNINTVKMLYDPDQYFPAEIISLTDDEVFIDCGAYNGDTLLSFMRKSPNRKCRKYYAIEPDKGHCISLKKTIDDHQFENVKIISKGIWDSEGIVQFTGGTTINASISSTGNISLKVDSIDNLFSHEEAVSFIKMDVQGVELKALQGASETIIRNKPTLAICIYHKPEDIFKILLYIKNIVPEYKFYMRHHEWSLIETVLYAVI